MVETNSSFSLGASARSQQMNTMCNFAMMTHSFFFFSPLGATIFSYTYILYKYMQVDKYITFRFTMRTHVRTTKDNKWWNVAQTEQCRAEAKTNGHAYFRLKHSSDSALADDGFRLLWHVFTPLDVHLPDRSDLNAHFCGQQINGLRYIRIERFGDQNKGKKNITDLTIRCWLWLYKNILVVSKVAEPERCNDDTVSLTLHAIFMPIIIIIIFFIFTFFHKRTKCCLHHTSPFPCRHIYAQRDEKQKKKTTANKICQSSMLGTS